MKILYVTNFWSGFADVVNHGLEEPKGMPGFNLPIKELIKQGIEVDFVVLSYKEQINTNAASWLKKCHFHFFNGLGFKNFNTLRKLISSKDYDFIYGQGCKPAFWANLFANMYKVPCGVRLYGTFMGEVLNENIFKSFFKHPYEFMLYNIDKKFLLTTDDGTKGDLVCNRFNIVKSSYDFHYWVNGFDIPLTKKNAEVYSEHDENLLFLPARFDRWKRQDMAIDILEVLVNRGLCVRLLLCGHYFDKAYVKELEVKIKEKGLDELITLQESMPKEELYKNMVGSTALLFCYDFSNFGNVLIESSSLGALNVVRNDGSSNRLIIDGETGILFDSIVGAADSIQAVIKGEVDSIKIRENCKAKARTVFTTWEKRISSEIELVTTYQSKC